MPRQSEDPVLVNGRREALIVFATWICAMAYTIGYCLIHGYGRKVEDLQYVWGFPDWVFWGIVVPWAVCIAFSCVFASIWMRDEDLGEDPPGAGSANAAGPDA
jgi:Protein of unknown function (DUF997)